MIMPHVVLSLALACVSGQAATTGSAPQAESQCRRVQYGEADVVTVKTKLRYTTLLILPKDETILDFTCGDKEFWVVDGTKNLAYVKPSKAGAKTNVNLVTAAGNVYSFALEEISQQAEALPDLKLFVDPKEETVISAMRGEPRFIPVEEVANYRDQASIAKEEARAAKQETERTLDARISSFLAEYPSRLNFDYGFLAGKKPFFVSSIWNDGRFTYIRTAAKELPVLYEIQDGKPNLVNFDARDGLLVVRKVVENGYLAAGKAKLYFYRKESQEP